MWSLENNSGILKLEALTVQVAELTVRQRSARTKTEPHFPGHAEAQISEPMFKIDYLHHRLALHLLDSLTHGFRLSCEWVKSADSGAKGWERRLSPWTHYRGFTKSVKSSFLMACSKHPNGDDTLERLDPSQTRRRILQQIVVHAWLWKTAHAPLKTNCSAEPSLLLSVFIWMCSVHSKNRPRCFATFFSVRFTQEYATVSSKLS